LLPEHGDSLSKARLDALVDATFGVAMTLLVIDIRLPDDFKPTSAAELLHAVDELKSKFLVYGITFFVVGLRWLGTTKLAEGIERVSGSFGRWTILHLFFITCMPFSTMMIGRYDDFAVSVWIYAANMIAGALVAMRLIQIAAHDAGRKVVPEDGMATLWLLIASALLSVAISFYDPGWALLAYLLNLGRPFAQRHK
jgi:uncharacterized membrane protein